MSEKINPATTAQTLLDFTRTTKRERVAIVQTLENALLDGKTGKDWEDAWAELGAIKMAFAKLETVFPPSRRPSERRKGINIT